MNAYSKQSNLSERDQNLVNVEETSLWAVILLTMPLPESLPRLQCRSIARCEEDEQLRTRSSRPQSVIIPVLMEVLVAAVS